MDNFFNITKTEINIGGIKEHKFLQISDTHICAYDELSSVAEKEKAIKQELAWEPVKEGFAKAFGDKFGDEQKIKTTEAFKKLMSYAKTSDAEALLLSGDNIDYMHKAGERFLKKQLADCGKKFICVPGNHEDDVLEGVWEEFSETYFDDIKIIAIANGKKTVTENTLLALESSLSENIPAIVMMHIPIATEVNREEMKTFSDYFVIDEESCDENAKLLIKLLRSKPVKAVLCGHVHGKHESIYYADKKQYCCSASMIGNIREIVIK